MAKLTPEQVHPTDATDAQWAWIGPLLAAARGPGRPQTIEVRRLANEEQGITVEVVRRSPDQRGCAVQPRCWMVECTFAWLGRSRRPSRDVECHERTTETLISLASCHLSLKRLHPAAS